MHRHLCSLVVTFLTILFATTASTPAAQPVQDQVFSNLDGGVSGGYVVGLYPNTDSSYTIGFNFAVPRGPDVQFNQGQFIASLDPSMAGDSNSNVTLQLYSSGPNGPASTLDTMTVNGLNDSPNLIQFNSNAHPLLFAGQQYWLVASMNDPSTTSLWWTPSHSDPGTEAASFNGSGFTLAPLARGGFALSGTPTQWQTHFSGSVNITGATGLQNAVMVFENFDANGNVLEKFVQPLGNFNQNQPANFNFTQPLKVNGTTGVYTILGTYGASGGNHGVVLGTTQSFGNSAVSKSSSFSDVFNGADEDTIYNELISGDDSDIQSFFDSQLQADGGVGGASGLPDIVLNGQDYQNMLAESGSLATGGACFVPNEDFVAMSTASQIGSGSLTMVTPEPSTGLMLILLTPSLLLRRRNMTAG